jgi:hypothetical protein
VISKTLLTNPIGKGDNLDEDWMPNSEEKKLD